MKPIRFNTEMVRAILDGRKTQTRRAIKKIPKVIYRYKNLVFFPFRQNKELTLWTIRNNIEALYGLTFKSKYQVGDILYVKEEMIIDCDLDPWYVADDAYVEAFIDDGTKPRPRFDKEKYHEEYMGSVLAEDMPKECARIFLRVTNVRVERLQDISEEDAEKEGLYSFGGCQIADTGAYDDGYWLKEKPFLSDDGMYYANEQFEYAEDAFASRWDDECKEGYKWGDNPYVFVYEFEKVEKPC